jgi:sialate O-acetylesterase
MNIVQSLRHKLLAVFVLEIFLPALAAGQQAATKPDIWVLSGQSNSNGWALMKAPIEPDPKILVFNEQNEWEIAREPLNKRFETWTPGPVDLNILLQRFRVSLPQGMTPEEFVRKSKPQGGVGPGVFFAKNLIKSVDRPVGLVYTGVGGTSIKQWDPSKGDSLYHGMIKRVTAAASQGELKGVIWYQGESDAMTPGEPGLYRERLLQLVDSIRRDTHVGDLPFVYVQLGRFVQPDDGSGRDWETVREAQRQAAALRPRMYMVSAIDVLLEEAIHVGFEGFQQLGARLAGVALTHVYGLPGHGSPIELDSMKVLQQESRRPLLRVRFRGVTGRLTSAGRPTGFELRTGKKVDSTGPAAKSADDPIYVVYRVDFDPADPAAVILGVFENSAILRGKQQSLKGPVSLLYGAGLNPYVNIVDAKDMPVPAFGPVEINLSQ